MGADGVDPRLMNRERTAHRVRRSGDFNTIGFRHHPLYVQPFEVPEETKIAQRDGHISRRVDGAVLHVEQPGRPVVRPEGQTVLRQTSATYIFVTMYPAIESDVALFRSEVLLGWSVFHLFGHDFSPIREDEESVHGERHAVVGHHHIGGPHCLSTDLRSAGTDDLYARGPDRAECHACPESLVGQTMVRRVLVLDPHFKVQALSLVASEAVSAAA